MVIVVVVVTMLALYSLDLSLNGPSRFKGIKYPYLNIHSFGHGELYANVMYLHLRLSNRLPKAKDR